MNPTEQNRGYSVYGQINYPLPPTDSDIGPHPAQANAVSYPDARVAPPIQEVDALQNRPVDGQGANNDRFDNYQVTPGSTNISSEVIKSKEDWSDLFVTSNHITSIGAGRSSDELLLTYRNLDAIAYYNTTTRTIKKAVKHGVKGSPR